MTSHRRVRGIALAIAALHCGGIALAQETVTRDERLLLVPSGGSGAQLFGASAAMDSGLAAFGAPGASAGEGRVSVFERGSSNSWPLSTTLQPAAAGTGGFGASVAFDGNLIVVGAPGSDVSGATDRGSVFVFRRQSGSWIQVAQLLASDGAAGDGFGATVAMKGSNLVVGAPGADVGGMADRGAAYAFENTSGNTWSQVAKMTAADGAAGDRFGSSSAMISSVALFGAPGRASGAGGAYLFRRTSGVWIAATTLQAGEPGSIGFGTSVSLASAADGQWAFVGAPFASNSGVQSGAAFVYRRSTDTSWPASARLSASDGGAGDAFGAALSAADDRVVIGAPDATVRGVAGAGAARLYRRLANLSWQEGSKLAARTGGTGAAFGEAIATAGERVMVGAPSASGSQGAGYHYKLDYVRTGIDDNGRGDVVWFNPATGALATWSMNGVARDSTGVVQTALGNSYEFDGIGDFFGDGRTAVLTRHKTTGAFRMLRIHGQTVIEDRAASAPLNYQWQYLAAGDISGDGKTDILLRNALTGQVNAWLMSGATKVSGGTLGNSTGLVFAGFGDFNADGRSDILWRDSAGTTRLWILNGAAVTSDAPVAGASAVDPAWRVAATADLDADGDDDVVWRHVVGGAVSGWIMQDGAVASAGTIHPGMPMTWRIEAAADLNGDGTEDLLWRNMANGSVNAWFMSGLTKTSGGFVRTVAGSWSMLNDDDYNDDHGRDGNGNDDNRDDADDDDFDDNGGGGGAVGSEAIASTAFNGALGVALGASSLPLLESEVEYEAGATYLVVVQWRASDAKLVRIAVNAATLAIASNAALAPSAGQLAAYQDAINALGLVTVAPSAAVSQASAANPGSLVRSVELDTEAGLPFWEVEIVTAGGVVAKIPVAAR